MTEKELEEELNYFPIWFDWIITHLALNANIELSNIKYKDTNYSSLSKHPIYLNTVTKFKNYTFNNGINAIKYWKNIIDDRRGY